MFNLPSSAADNPKVFLAQAYPTPQPLCFEYSFFSEEKLALLHRPVPSADEEIFTRAVTRP
ncbi:hypothetical protein [Nostoc sp. C110]|uniref:hypothetical protein n=1 Tax=Nostoc sp. C110 TaxID=3349876 RepID=UPI00370D708A